MEDVVIVRLSCGNASRRLGTRKKKWRNAHVDSAERKNREGFKERSVLGVRCRALWGKVQEKRFETS